MQRGGPSLASYILGKHAEIVPRLDSRGQQAGTVTAAHVLYARQQASRQRVQNRRNRATQNRAHRRLLPIHG
jgi:sRNA-binding protein